MIPVDLLLFDMDGTLIDTRQDLTNSINYARQQFKLSPLTLEDVLQSVGDGVKNLLKRTLPFSDEEKIAQALSHFREHYKEHLLDFSKYYPGVPAVLNFFKNKKKVVVSNKPERFTQKIIDGLGANDDFLLVIGGDTVGLKPGPEPVLYALQQLDVQPEKAVIIGDSPSDMIAGRKAGTLTCAVTYGYRARDLLEKYDPDFIIDSMIQLKELFV